jgi:hypothetical protein
VGDKQRAARARKGGEPKQGGCGQTGVLPRATCLLGGQFSAEAVLAAAAKVRLVDTA